MIRRIILTDHCDCAGCGVPLLPGEVAYRDDQTGTTGHDLDCAADALRDLIDQHEVAAFRAGFDLNLTGGAA